MTIGYVKEHLKAKTPAAAAIVGLLVVVAAVVVTRVFGVVVGDSLDIVTRKAISLVRMWAISGVLVALVLYWEQRPLASIGLQRPTVKTIGLGVGGFIANLVVFTLLNPIINALGLGTTQEAVRAYSPLSIWITVLLAVTAGITEEIIFRGYLLERIEEATGALWVGAVLSAVIFTLLHLPQWGAGATLQIGIWTAIVTVYYIMTRDLGATILLHVLNDLFNIVIPML